MQPEKKSEQPDVLDLLREAMDNWHFQTGLYPRLVRELVYKLQMEGDNKSANQMHKVFAKLDDRWIDVASVIAEYEKPKLSRVDIRKDTNYRYVVEAPRQVSTYKPQDPVDWLENVENERTVTKLLENIGNGQAK